MRRSRRASTISSPRRISSTGRSSSTCVRGGWIASIARSRSDRADGWLVGIRRSAEGLRAMALRRNADWLGVLPLSVFFAAFYLVPFVLLVLVSFDPAGRIGGFDIRNYAALLGDRFSLGILLDTLILGIEVTLVAT